MDNSAYPRVETLVVCKTYITEEKVLLVSVEVDNIYFIKTKPAILLVCYVKTKKQVNIYTTDGTKNNALSLLCL